MKETKTVSKVSRLDLRIETPEGPERIAKLVKEVFSKGEPSRRKRGTYGNA